MGTVTAGDGMAEPVTEVTELAVGLVLGDGRAKRASHGFVQGGHIRRPRQQARPSPKLESSPEEHHGVVDGRPALGTGCYVSAAGGIHGSRAPRFALPAAVTTVGRGIAGHRFGGLAGCSGGCGVSAECQV